MFLKHVYTLQETECLTLLGNVSPRQQVPAPLQQC